MLLMKLNYHKIKTKKLLKNNIKRNKELKIEQIEKIMMRIKIKIIHQVKNFKNLV